MRGYTYIYTLKISPRVVSCACVIGGSCTNCGVSRTTNGLCSRCLDLPYCKKCKRHLSFSSFNGEQRHICQVHLQIILFVYFTYRYKSDYYFTSRYRYTFSRLCMLIELRKATHRTTHRTQQRHSRNFLTCHPIRHILRNTCQHTLTRHREHRSRRLTAARVLTRLFFYSLFFYSR